MAAFISRAAILSFAFLLLTLPVLAQGPAVSSLSAGLSEIAKRSGRKTIAVVDFTDLQGCVTELGRYMAEDVSVALVNSANGFDVIDRTNLRVLMQEHKLASTGIIDPATARKLGDVIGVDALVTGTIAPLSDSVHVSAKVLDTATAKMLGGITADIPKTKTVEELLAKGVANCGGSKTTEPAATNVAPPANTTQPQTKESAAADIGEFHFLIQACRHNGEKIECWGNVTNQGTKRSSLVVDDRATSIVDNFGNVSRSGMFMNMSKTIIRIGNAQTLGPGGTVGAELEPSLPLVFQVSGTALDDAATYVTIVLSTQEGKTVMRNITVRTH
jgi:TolB-like protein